MLSVEAIKLGFHTVGWRGGTGDWLFGLYIRSDVGLDVSPTPLSSALALSLGSDVERNQG
jgi:hypothetical protein